MGNQTRGNEFCSFSFQGNYQAERINQRIKLMKVGVKSTLWMLIWVVCLLYIYKSTFALAAKTSRLGKGCSQTQNWPARL